MFQLYYLDTFERLSGTAIDNMAFPYLNLKGNSSCQSSICTTGAFFKTNNIIITRNVFQSLIFFLVMLFLIILKILIILLILIILVIQRTIYFLPQRGFPVGE